MLKLTRTRIAFPIVGILFVAAMTTLAVAQVGESDQRKRNAADSERIEDEIPPAALKTAEGRQMAERLQFLRRSQASIGPKHPAYRGIQAEIEQIRQNLGMSPTAGSTPEGVAGLDAMGDDELRLLIRRMALRIDSLEKRLDALERRLEVF